MAENSSIEWTDATFNPWSGCSKISDGCKNCYAAVNYSVKMRGVKWGPQGNRIVAAESMWKQPLKWDRMAREGICPECDGKRVVKSEEYDWQPCTNCDPSGKVEPYRSRVFCASLADVFEDWQGVMLNAKSEVLFASPRGNWLAGGDESLYAEGHPIGTRPPEVTMQDVRDRLFRLIDATPNLDWLLLTKRPENVERMMPANWLTKRGTPVAGCTWKTEWKSDWRLPPNLWLGTSCENQQTADERIPHLLRTPAAVRFLSCEPLLGPVEFSDVSRRSDAVKRLGKNALDGIHWVICGGESGHGARPMHPNWVRAIRDQCQAAGVAFFFKQWGAFQPFSTTDGRQLLPFGEYVLPTVGNNGCGFLKKGKKKSGRVLDGREWSEFPKEAAT